MLHLHNVYISPSSISSSLSHNSRMHLLQSSYNGQTCSQSEALSLSSGLWHFSDFRIPLNLSSNHSAFRLWLCSSSSSRLAFMLRLSAVAMEMMSELMRGGACGNPLRPLKDWTAPPSLSSDHWLVGSCVFIKLINVII